MVGLPATVRARALFLLGGAAVVGAVLALFTRDPSAISLTERTVDLAAPPDLVFQQMSAFDQGLNIVERNANQLVVEFPIEVGRYRVTTLERVTLDPERRRLVFEQMRSPFFSIRTATETFQLQDGPGGGATLTVGGLLWPRLGAFGWLVTRWLVRPRWDDIEAKHLDRLRERFATPAAHTLS